MITVQSTTVRACSACLVAAAIVTSCSTFSGDAGDAGAEEAGVPDAVVEAAPEAGVDAGADTTVVTGQFCSGKTFEVCSDFSGPSAGTNFDDTNVQGAAQVSLTKEASVSPPAAFASTIVAGSGTQAARLVEHLPNAMRSVHFEAQVWIDCPGGDGISIAEIYCAKGSSSGGLILSLAGGSVQLNIRSNSASAPDTFSNNLRPPFGVSEKTWHPIVLDAEFGEGKPVRLDIDGMPANNLSTRITCYQLTAGYDLLLGLHRSGSGGGNCAVYYDNVLLRISE